MPRHNLFSGIGASLSRLSLFSFSVSRDGLCKWTKSIYNSANSCHDLERKQVSPVIVLFEFLKGFFLDVLALFAGEDK